MTLAQKAWEILGAEADLDCNTMVQICGAVPPPPVGGNHHFVTVPPPWGGGSARHKGRDFKGGEGTVWPRSQGIQNQNPFQWALTKASCKSNCVSQC